MTLYTYYNILTIYLLYTYYILTIYTYYIYLLYTYYILTIYLLYTNYIFTVYLLALLVPGQLRCGEHTDFGSITLLYSDAPGLQVK